MSNYYICPKPFGARDSDAEGQLGWAKEAIQQARTYLRIQPAYKYIQEGMDLVNGDEDRPKIPTLSDAKTSKTTRNLRELIASQSNIRIIPAFKTELREFASTQLLLNKTYMAWQTMTFADRAARKAIQYAFACGTGYLGCKWDPNYYWRGKGEIIFEAYGPLDVMPLGLPRSHKLAKAYAKIIRTETPYHEVIRRYPEFIDKIKPSRENSKGRGGNVIAAAVKYASAALRKFGPGASIEHEAAPWAMVDVYTIYIDDDSINSTGEPILMGDPGTTWEYMVPYVGQEIKIGTDVNGNPTYRKATVEDARLYPSQRKMVCTDDIVLTPDPIRQVNEYWHGDAPMAQFRSDDWPWSYLGFSVCRQGLPLERANGEMLRGAVDAFNVRLSPPRAFDRNTMAQSLAQTINTRIPNQVVGLDLSFAGEQMKPLIPAEYLDVPALVPEFMEQNERRISDQMGVADASALAQARQLPSGDSLERIMESLGPIIKDQSRNMEESFCLLGNFWKSNVFQFYRAPRLMQMLGQNGVIEEEFEMNPGDLIPETVPGAPPEAPKYLLARHHSNNFTFSVTPYSLHEINSVTRKLFFLQLTRSGFPIDWWTLAEAFDLRNFGNKPLIDDPEKPGQKREVATILEAWVEQQQIQLRMQAAAMGMQAQMAAQYGGQQPGGQPGGGGAPPQGAVPGGGAPVGSSGPGGIKKPEGRPPTAQNPPAMTQGSGGRPIVRESKH